jgi:hypothetical protein
MAARAALLSAGVLALSLLSAAAAAQEPVRLDGLAAVVGGDSPGPGVDVILRSDVELRARIALAGRTRGPLPLGPVPVGLLKATLQEIIGEHLIAREARRVQAADPSSADVARERGRLVRSAGGSQRLGALLSALSARDDELDTVAERRALVAAFLNANLEGATVVTSNEVERAYAGWLAEHGSETGEAPEAVKARLRARLSRESLARTIERWVRVLRARMPVRVYAQYIPH